MRPSQDPSHPTQVDARGVFMFCSGEHEVTKDPVTDLSCITVGAGRQMVLRAVSGSNNADDAVIVYAVRTRSSADNLVATPFNPVVVTLDAAVQPDPDSPDGGIPPLAVEMNFSSLNSSAVVMAPRLLTADFGLYTLAPDGHSQQLHGYFRWVFRLQRENPSVLPDVKAAG
ncbi:inclusion body family protein [Hydrogenophaga soli]